MKQLFSIQKQLDDRILEEHGLQRNEVHTDKMLALMVEIGELANETRCFKYWSTKPASSREVIAEEYVDGLHFILSLGIDGGWEEVPETREQNLSSLTDRFHEVYQAVSELYAVFTKENYLHLFQTYLTLGSSLGFSEKEMEEAYLQKNSANHQRQQEGY